MAATRLGAEDVPIAHTVAPALGPPPDWTGTDAPSSGWIIIPDHVDPTNPRRVYELDDPAQRKYVYEIVLTDGAPTDINRLINREHLTDLWDHLYLPHDVRAAWRRAVRAGGGSTDRT